jgi:hypothetical protein
VTRHFIIATDPLSAAEQRKLSASLKGCGWWHWLPHLWLVADDKDQLTVEQIRDKIHAINQTVRAWVLQVEPVTWAALTKNDDQGRDGTEWIEKDWNSM